MVTAFFGLRRSETLGLRWESVDFENRLLSINHKIVRAKQDGKQITLATDELKSEASYRILPLNDTLIAYLKAVKQKQDLNRERNGNFHISKYDDYICVNEIGDLIKPDYLSDLFSKIIKRNNLKHITLHGLRHSCASMLLALGYSMKSIQGWLGHSNYQTTANLYCHVDPGDTRGMIDGLSDALDIP